MSATQPGLTGGKRGLIMGVAIENVGGSALYLLSGLSSGVPGETHFVDSGYNIISIPRPEDLKSATD